MVKGVLMVLEGRNQELAVALQQKMQAAARDLAF